MRVFNKRQKTALYLCADGKCQICGCELISGWHADHIKPYSKGGKTDVINGQALCQKCNLKKGSKYMELREWQKECFDDWVNKDQENYLISSTPGAGKTIMALAIARHCLDNYIVERIVIVVPTQTLKFQWADDASKLFSIELDPNNYYETRESQGVVITYHALNTNDYIHQKLCNSSKTLVVFDEIHHAGEDNNWGDSILNSFQYANKRVLLTGTPFRTDKKRIPFVNYTKNKEGDFICVPDKKYSYEKGIKDNILKKLYFISFDGSTNFMTSDGNTYENIKLSEHEKNKKILSNKKKAAYYLDNNNYMDDWLYKTLIDANQKLEDIRNDIDGRPDAAGIIFVEDKIKARCYETNKKIKSILGETPTIVYSDPDIDSKDVIKNFKNNSKRWIVCINQISEGIDIKRLCVGVYCSNDSTELIFRQRVARIIRIDNRYITNDFSYFYIPATQDLKELASKIENECDHAIEEIDFDEMQEREKRERYEKESLFDFISFGTKDVKMDSVTIKGKIYEAPHDIINEVMNDPDYIIFPKEHLYIIAHKMYLERQKNTDKENKEKFKAEPIYKQKNDLSIKENKLVKKLARIRMKTTGGEIGSIIKEINTSLIKHFGKTKSELSFEELLERINIIIDMIKDEANV